MRLTLALPVYNEELVLEANVRKVHQFLDSQGLLHDTQIIIADNASTDQTREIGRRLAEALPQVFYFLIPAKGKGLAIRQAWEQFPADIFGFMDIDLATDLEALPRALTAATAGADLVFGSRWAPTSKVERSWLRTMISGGYRLCQSLLLGFATDANCGFKFVTPRVVYEILPEVRDNAFFFDMELLFLARARGLNLSELSIHWVEHPIAGRKSTVKIFRTAQDYLKNMWELRRRFTKHF